MAGANAVLYGTALSYIEPKFAYFLDWHHMKEKFISVDDKLSEDVVLE